MNNFIYDIPTKVYFGQGQIVHLPELIQTCGSRVLLVYGGGREENGVVRYDYPPVERKRD